MLGGALGNLSLLKIIGPLLLIIKITCFSKEKKNAELRQGAVVETPSGKVPKWGWGGFGPFTAK